MKDFKKGGYKGGSQGGGFGDRNSFGSKPSFGARPSFKKPWEKSGSKPFNKEDRQMFDATCSNCGKPCQVPFRPSGGKEVFCNDCFSKMKGDEGFERGDRNDRGGDRGGFQDRAPKFAPNGQNMDAVVRQIQVVASKLDILINMMNAQAKPKADKPAASAVPALAAIIEKAVSPAKAKPAPAAKKAVVAKKAAKKVSKK